MDVQIIRAFPPAFPVVSNGSRSCSGVCECVAPITAAGPFPIFTGFPFKLKQHLNHFEIVDSHQYIGLFLLSSQNIFSLDSPMSFYLEFPLDIFYFIA